MQIKKSIVLFLFFHLLIGPYSFAQVSNLDSNPWHFISETSIPFVETKERQIIPKKYKTVELKLDRLIHILDQAPVRFSAEAAQIQIVLTLPMPDGQFQQFQIEKASIMHPKLAERYSSIQSFSGKGIDDPSASIRFDLTPHGFHAMILTGRSSSVFIDPFAKGDQDHYVSYYKKDYERAGGNTFTCHIDGSEISEDDSMINTINNPGSDLELVAPAQGDCQLRTYRLALAVVGEYTVFHGGTKELALAAMVTAMTRINGIYEKDAAITMVMVENTDELIFLNPANDPYSNSSGDLGANQETCDDIIGFNNYDIGHLFTTGGGGIASLNSPCTQRKGQGLSGQGDPIGDPFTVDYVAHEMGHQYGASHTQNNSCNRVDNTAMEPGSASTIMGYAGICSPDVQFNSDDHFHAISLQEIAANVNFGASSGCPITFDTGNNPPIIDDGANYLLPVSTPFILTAVATDIDDDELTYCWEQMDNQIAPMPPIASSDRGPAFRSNSPTTSPSRSFPNLTDLNNNVDPEWEELPAVTRSMKFRCTVRDNASGAGCTTEDDIVLNFTDQAGPFLVLNPNTDLTWIVGDFGLITWDVANTDEAPVNCTEVNILLSTDGGLTYPITLAENVVNSGELTIEIPDYVGTQNRVKVVCADNIFFDISNTDFTIVAPTGSGIAMNITPATQRFCSTEESISFDIQLNGLAGFEETVNLGVGGLASGVSISFDPSSQLSLPGEATVTINNPSSLPPGDNSIEILASAGMISTSEITLLQVVPGAPEEATLTAPANNSLNIEEDIMLSWETEDFTDFSIIEIATNPGFGPESIIETITVEGNTYFPQNLESFTVYYWRIIPGNICDTNSSVNFWSFQTLNTFCTKYTNTDGLNIPVNQVGIFSSTMMINDDLNILDFNISLDIQHGDINQLFTYLKDPNDVSYTLFTNPGIGPSGCEEDLLVTFDSEAESTSQDFKFECNPGTYQPSSSFLPLNNQSSQGEWKLEVTDITPAQGGMVQAWQIEICSKALDEIKIALNNQVLAVPQAMNEVITSSYLSANSANNTEEDLRYLITHLPTYGSLSLNEIPLNIGSTFSQSDINNNQLSYTHNGSANFNDSFLFDVTNMDGTWSSNNTFSIVIYGDALSGVPYIDQGPKCFGGSDAQISINAFSGVAPYLYSIDGNNFSSENIFDDLNAGSYNFVIQDANNTTFEINSVVINNPTPIVASHEVINDQVTISANGGTGTLMYSLDGNNYQESNIFTDLENGEYSAHIQDVNGCVSTTDFQILFTSIKKVIEDFAFEIQPNPTSQSFVLRLFTQSSEEVQLKIFDMVGQLLDQQNLGFPNIGVTKHIDVSHLTGGIYNIQIKSGHLIGSTRLVIIK